MKLLSPSLFSSSQPPPAPTSPSLSSSPPTWSSSATCPSTSGETPHPASRSPSTSTEPPPLPPPTTSTAEHLPPRPTRRRPLHPHHPRPEHRRPRRHPHRRPLAGLRSVQHGDAPRRLRRRTPSSRTPPTRSPAANHPQIRLLQIRKDSADYPLEDFKAVAGWSLCTPDSAKTSPPPPYFFGRDLQQKENVPIGLIDSTWGGSPAEAWTSMDALGADASLISVFAARADHMDIETTQQRIDLVNKQARAEHKPTIPIPNTIPTSSPGDPPASTTP